VARFTTAAVAEILAERTGLQRVRLYDGSHAYVLTALTGPVAIGDEVIVNTTAVDLDLGTGGWHVVHWNLSRRTWDHPGAGHLMKLRYTSLQAEYRAAEEISPSEAPVDLAGRPVVVCSLHSQLGIVAAVVRELEPSARIAYVMTDGAALPLALSDLVAELCALRLLDVTVTAGHAFGGDLEAVNVPSALDVAARIGGADIVIVAMGPGVVGTGTALGTSALEVAPTIDAAVALGGEAIVAVRASDADARPRHRGVSHHSATSLRLAARAASVAHAAATTAFDVPPPHRVVTVDVPAVGPLLARVGLTVTTMGRGPDDDRRFFATTAAAGVLAARLHRERDTLRP
jgi:Protein of unknown function (DUF3866)